MVIENKHIDQWINEYPLLKDIINTEEVFWVNDKLKPFDDIKEDLDVTYEDIIDASNRLDRFSKYIQKVFPETANNNGLIESPLRKIPEFVDLQLAKDLNVDGELLLKCDSHLSISGSIKARGGIYEVLKYAEELALNNNLLALEDDYSIIDSVKFKDFFSKYTIAVGSTGNLGLSIGIMSAKFGFNVNVHMSSDAKTWKKDLLRSKGVNVIEYDDDYSKAVTEGRKLSDSDPMSYFVDDENSKDLFLGYAVAALRLKEQLKSMHIPVDSNNNLFVYLPCGVGGGPGGIALGLKYIFKDNVHCFFAEPTHSPCMLLGLMTGYHDKICVQDFGIDNITEADGLAVGRPSSFVGRNMEYLLSGIYTNQDDVLFKHLAELADSEGVYLEPSALAGIPGILKLNNNSTGLEYLSQQGLLHKKCNITHIAWATGGSMVPKTDMKTFYTRGKY